jgi:hypothetical protein
VASRHVRTPQPTISKVTTQAMAIRSLRVNDNTGALYLPSALLTTEIYSTRFFPCHASICWLRCANGIWLICDL